MKRNNIRRWLPWAAGFATIIACICFFIQDSVKTQKNSEAMAPQKVVKDSQEKRPLIASPQDQSAQRKDSTYYRDVLDRAKRVDADGFAAFVKAIEADPELIGGMKENALATGVQTLSAKNPIQKTTDLIAQSFGAGTRRDYMISSAFTATQDSVSSVLEIGNSFEVEEEIDSAFRGMAVYMETHSFEAIKILERKGQMNLNEMRAIRGGLASEILRESNSATRDDLFDRNAKAALSLRDSGNMPNQEYLKFLSNVSVSEPMKAWDALANLSAASDIPSETLVGETSDIVEEMVSRNPDKAMGMIIASEAANDSLTAKHPEILVSALESWLDLDREEAEQWFVAYHGKISSGQCDLLVAKFAASKANQGDAEGAQDFIVRYGSAAIQKKPEDPAAKNEIAK